MPSLSLCFSKHPDGRVTLQCRRADGTVTWQCQEGPNAWFFPRHDLTHVAVETILTGCRGFDRLVAEGWAFSDFGSPWPRGPLPPDTFAAELIVGFLDTERASGVEMNAADFNEQAAAYYSARELAGLPPTITPAQLQDIRALRGDLFARWEATVPGVVLELEFEIARSQ